MLVDGRGRERFDSFDPLGFAKEAKNLAVAWSRGARGQQSSSAL
jgi:hypothetical protein